VSRSKRKGLTEFDVLQRVGKEILPSYRFRWPQIAWLQNRKFWRLLASFGEQEGLNADRKWMVGQLIRLSVHLPGDTVECGVYRGATSYLICNAVRDDGEPDKRHHLFDSFAGLSEPGERDGEHWTAGDLACSEEDVLKSLDEFHRFVVSHRGWIPERFDEVADRTFCFVHVDVDLYQPTRDCLEFFYPRLDEGGILVCDDYGFTTCPGVTEAVDAFLANKPEDILSLPSGGGFLIKGAPVQARNELTCL
jgi:hypothetical protein